MKILVIANNAGGLYGFRKELINGLAENKAEEEAIARALAETAQDGGLYRLMKGLERSARLVNEDLLRESGYMLPQGKNAHELLRELSANPPSPGFPVEVAKKLDTEIPCNEEREEKWYTPRLLVRRSTKSVRAEK